MKKDTRKQLRFHMTTKNPGVNSLTLTCCEGVELGNKLGNAEGWK